jgi:hypothetical protein
MDRNIQSSKDRESYWFNGIVALIYIIVTSTMFVMRRNPDPIGIGYLQWVAILAHLVLLILFYAASAKRPGNWRKFGFAIGGLLSVVVLYFLLNTPVWNLLWRLRDY